jgi:hypothetical protein
MYCLTQLRNLGWGPHIIVQCHSHHHLRCRKDQQLHCFIRMSTSTLPRPTRAHKRIRLRPMLRLAISGHPRREVCRGDVHACCVCVCTCVCVRPLCGAACSLAVRPLQLTPISHQHAEGGRRKGQIRESSRTHKVAHAQARRPKRSTKHLAPAVGSGSLPKAREYVEHHANA